MLHCIAATGIEADRQFGVPAIVIIMRKQGVSIGQTLAAIDECVAGGWLGAHGAKKLAKTRGALNAIFAGVIIVVAIYMLFHSLRG